MTAAPRPVLVFLLGARWVACPAELVSTILEDDLPRTVVPCAPAHVLGVVNHGGRALPVFDAAAFLGFGSSAGRGTQRLIVVSGSEMSVGIPSREVQGVMTPTQAVRAPPDPQPPFTLGLLDLVRGPVEVLDVPGLLAAAAVRRV